MYENMQKLTIQIYRNLILFLECDTVFDFAHYCFYVALS